MGSVKKALKPITRVVDDIIPNEIKPALPYIAATFGTPFLAPAAGIFKSQALGKGITAALLMLEQELQWVEMLILYRRVYLDCLRVLVLFWRGRVRLQRV